jgi:simple sugar transport system ATP-binding protein
MTKTKTNQAAPLLELRGVSKHFAGIAAINEVSFDVTGGEVICLLGDNGAGKSTLIKTMSGVHRPTNGQIYMDGKAVDFGSPREARAAGIATVHQDVGVIPLMSVSRNFFVGAEPTKGPKFLKWIDFSKANEIALEEIHALGITRVRDGGQLVGTMSGGEKQALGIGRAMHFGARVLILDEPTSALGVKESEIVLRLIMKAKARGVAVVFITHNVGHAMTVGDRYIVLIHGEVAADFRRGEKSREEILDLMAGGEQLRELAMEIEHLDAAALEPDAV